MKFLRKQFIKFTAIIVTLTTVYSMLPVQAVSQLTDINGNFAEEQIQTWVDEGLIEGYPDGTFKPDKFITRAEFMSLVNRAFGYKNEAEIIFNDVTEDAWYFTDVAKAVEAGYLDGYPDNTMKPDDHITRQEAAKVIAVIKSLNKDEESANSFKDSESISDWSKGFVGGVAAENLMVGYPDGSFKPLHNITRAEVVMTLHNVSESDEVVKPSKPQGTEDVLSVDIPEFEQPLSAVKNGGNADDPVLKNIAATNPFIHILDGFDDIWSMNQPDWRDGTALIEPGANGELANYGDGPSVYFDGYKNDETKVVADKKTYANEEIRNSETWVANIKYVEDVTQNRTDEEALAAYYDDQRDKTYSMMEAFGPLANTYAEIVNAETSVIRTTDEMNTVLQEETVEDQYQGLGDGADSELAEVVDLVDLIRQRTPASSNPSKYFFSSPRPYRMNSNGEVIEVVDANGLPVWETIGSGETVEEALPSGGKKVTGEKHFQQYETNVEIIPALEYVKRKAEDGRGKDGAYPSGHTSASYLSSFAFAYSTPERYSEFLTRAAQMGENRIVSGMHSPLDVIGARIQATAMTAYAFNKEENKEVMKKAYENAGEVFGELAEANNMSLYEYAHTVTEYNFESAYEEEKWEDHDANKAFYREKLTYGLPQTGTIGLKPVIPEGAEALLETRQPYLTDKQRREVLYTTSIESGYPVLDESNGWGRIDLVTAADGYGAFLSNVTVNMDASEGRFNAHDWWRNDISGSGMLTKQGTGMLTLTGNNSYTGGTLLQEGILEAASSTAFGNGDLYIENGTVLVSADEALHLDGNFTMEAGNLDITIDDNSSQLNVNGLFFVEGGNLNLDLSDYEAGKAQDIIIITADTVEGEFDNVTVNGEDISVTYEGNQVIAHIEAK
ncbi:autotransporter-associated beta strand repeat-containing protein [Gracilibacillus ureilyticus]|uniref:Autotransporter-associated beta strand repeat-containing protein n=1 Tax=Gracilibacillus ureilyticus TaxID=531814 RepID=A0A1H9TB49_9BACI|nr:S-layer homology domain-containing protein [Gracilibacillus ureilyticus]SER94540.1 autotransporter-associated beta strand repeat-containing protein [Gracilibacillus ureilyticus]